MAIKEEIDPTEEIQEEPVFPYVTFQTMKNVTPINTPKNKVILRKSTVHLDVSGSLGHIDNLNNIQKRGLVCVGSGNLQPRQHKEIIAWVGRATGSTAHPALRASAMDAKIAKAETELKEELAAKTTTKKPRQEASASE